MPSRTLRKVVFTYTFIHNNNKNNTTIQEYIRLWCGVISKNKKLSDEWKGYGRERKMR